MTPRPAAQAACLWEICLIVPALLIHALTGGHSDILIAGPVQNNPAFSRH